MSDLSAYSVSTDGAIEAVEIWRKIPQDSRYEASNLGSIRRIGSDKPLKLQPVNKYLVFTVRVGKKHKHHYAHRCVLAAFNPMEGWQDMFVNHKDFDTANNALSNLEFVTPAGNLEYSRLRGRFVECYKRKAEVMREKMLNGTHPLSNMTEEIKRKISETMKRKHQERKLAA